MDSKVQKVKTNFLFHPQLGNKENKLKYHWKTGSKENKCGHILMVGIL